MSVDRCVCHRVSFAALRDLAERLGIEGEDAAVRALSERTGCCTGCGLCEPYVRLMLRTGRTRFTPLPPPAKGNAPARP